MNDEAREREEEERRRQIERQKFSQHQQNLQGYQDDFSTFQNEDNSYQLNYPTQRDYDYEDAEFDPVDKLFQISKGDPYSTLSQFTGQIPSDLEGLRQQPSTDELANPTLNDEEVLSLGYAINNHTRYTDLFNNTSQFLQQLNGQRSKLDLTRQYKNEARNNSLIQHAQQLAEVLPPLLGNMSQKNYTSTALQNMVEALGQSPAILTSYKQATSNGQHSSFRAEAFLENFRKATQQGELTSQDIADIRRNYLSRLPPMNQLRNAQGFLAQQENTLESGRTIFAGLAAIQEPVNRNGPRKNVRQPSLYAQGTATPTQHSSTLFPNEELKESHDDLIYSAQDGNIIDKIVNQVKTMNDLRSYLKTNNLSNSITQLIPRQKVINKDDRTFKEQLQKAFDQILQHTGASHANVTSHEQLRKVFNDYAQQEFSQPQQLLTGNPAKGSQRQIQVKTTLSRAGKVTNLQRFTQRQENPYDDVPDFEWKTEEEKKEESRKPPSDGAPSLNMSTVSNRNPIFNAPLDQELRGDIQPFSFDEGKSAEITMGVPMKTPYDQFNENAKDILHGMSQLAKTNTTQGEFPVTQQPLINQPSQLAPLEEAKEAMQSLSRQGQDLQMQIGQMASDVRQQLDGIRNLSEAQNAIRQTVLREHANLNQQLEGSTSRQATELRQAIEAQRGQADFLASQMQARQKEMGETLKTHSEQMSRILQSNNSDWTSEQRSILNQLNQKIGELKIIVPDMVRDPLANLENAIKNVSQKSDRRANELTQQVSEITSRNQSDLQEITRSLGQLRQRVSEETGEVTESNRREIKAIEASLRKTIDEMGGQSREQAKGILQTLQSQVKDSKEETLTRVDKLQDAIESLRQSTTATTRQIRDDVKGGIDELRQQIAQMKEGGATAKSQISEQMREGLAEVLEKIRRRKDEYNSSVSEKNPVVFLTNPTRDKIAQMNAFVKSEAKALRKMERLERNLEGLQERLDNPTTGQINLSEYSKIVNKTHQALKQLPELESINERLRRENDPVNQYTELARALQNSTELNKTIGEINFTTREINAALATGVDKQTVQELVGKRAALVTRAGDISAHISSVMPNAKPHFIQSMTDTFNNKVAERHTRKLAQAKRLGQEGQIDPIRIPDVEQVLSEQQLRANSDLFMKMGMTPEAISRFQSVKTIVPEGLTFFQNDLAEAIGSGLALHRDIDLPGVNFRQLDHNDRNKEFVRSHLGDEDMHDFVKKLTGADAGVQTDEQNHFQRALTGSINLARTLTEGLNSQQQHYLRGKFDSNRRAMQISEVNDYGDEYDRNRNLDLLGNRYAEDHVYGSDVLQREMETPANVSAEIQQRLNEQREQRAMQLRSEREKNVRQADLINKRQATESVIRNMRLAQVQGPVQGNPYGNIRRSGGLYEVFDQVNPLRATQQQQQNNPDMLARMRVREQPSENVLNDLRGQRSSDPQVDVKILEELLPEDLLKRKVSDQVRWVAQNFYDSLAQVTVAMDGDDGDWPDRRDLRRLENNLVTLNRMRLYYDDRVQKRFQSAGDRMGLVPREDVDMEAVEELRRIEDEARIQYDEVRRRLDDPYRKPPPTSTAGTPQPTTAITKEDQLEREVNPRLEKGQQQMNILLQYLMKNLGLSSVGDIPHNPYRQYTPVGAGGGTNTATGGGGGGGGSSNVSVNNGQGRLIREKSRQLFRGSPNAGVGQSEKPSEQLLAFIRQRKSRYSQNVYKLMKEVFYDSNENQLRRRSEDGSVRSLTNEEKLQLTNVLTDIVLLVFQVYFHDMLTSKNHQYKKMIHRRLTEQASSSISEGFSLADHLLRYAQSKAVDSKKKAMQELNMFVRGNQENTREQGTTADAEEVN